MRLRDWISSLLCIVGGYLFGYGMGRVIGPLPPAPVAQPAAPAVSDTVSLAEPDLPVRVEAPPPAPSGDPCADLRGRLSALEAELAACRASAALWEREALLSAYPAETPWGAFLRGPEASLIGEPSVRARLKDWLVQLPVVLRPGEALWLAERERLQDWATWGGTANEVVVHFLGVQRLVREVPAEALARFIEQQGCEDLFQ